jgi:hypothetical protein
MYKTFKKVKYMRRYLRAKNIGKLLRILQNVIEKNFIKWQVLPLVKINTRI